MQVVIIAAGYCTRAYRLKVGSTAVCAAQPYTPAQALEQRHLISRLHTCMYVVILQHAYLAGEV